MGLDEFSDLFNKTKTIEDQYLDTLKQEYELNKLNRQLEQSISKTDSLSAKAKLRDLTQEINEIE
jgi:hypothetical protein